MRRGADRRGVRRQEITECGACETLPDDPEIGWLYIWPSATHVGGKILKAANELGLEALAIDGESIRWTVLNDKIEHTLAALGGHLLPEERDGTKVLMTKAGTEPGLGDFRRVMSLDRMIGTQRARWLSDLLADGRLEIHFQPILDVRAPTHIVAHECLLRGRTRAGELIPPTELFVAAKQGGLLFQLDLAARREAVMSIARKGLPSLAMINFTPTSIYDPATCLRSTMATVRELGLDPRFIVFEIIETEQADEGLLKSILAVYRSAGFQVAIDDFGAGYSSLNLLNALRPDYVKLDMALIRGIDSDPYKAELARGLLETARNLCIKTIAEGVETEAEWNWVSSHGADLVQGFYFARPAVEPLAALPGRHV